MQEMDRRVALLRLLLADIADRERQAGESARLLRGQLTRIVEFTIQRNGGVSNALAAMAEAEERLAQQETTLRHLAMLRKRTQSEIQALLVTRGVSDARLRLAELESRRAALLDAGGAHGASEEAPVVTTELSEIEAEITELKAQIEAASDAAARALTGGEAQHAPRDR